MEDSSWGFDMLPAEIKQVIFSFTDLNLAMVLRLQSVSSTFKKLCWQWMRDYDSSVLVDKERTPVVAAYFLTRTNPNILRRIDFTYFDNPLASALKVLKGFPNLETIDFGYLRIYHDKKQALIAQAEQHPKLREIRFDYEYSYRQKSSQNSEQTRDTFKSYSPIHSRFDQQKPIAFHRVYHRGGTIGENMIVIGATDGTLTFLTLDAVKINLKIQSTDYNCHKACINAIWAGVESINNLTQARARPNTYIASSDGIVTSWSCANDEPVLNQTIVFPESILFVCDHADKYVLAAGKRTIYIAEIHSSKIIKQVAFDDDITGLVCGTNKATLSTSGSLYSLKTDIASEDVVQKEAEMICPNLSLSIDKSLMMIVRPEKISLIERETSSQLENTTDSYGTSYFDRFRQYDARPHLAQFSPSRYWMTASIGTKLVTWDLETTKLYGYLTAGLSPIDTDPEHPPKCNTFWYSSCGNYLFGLYSNNTLYWWHTTPK